MISGPRLAGSLTIVSVSDKRLLKISPLFAQAPKNLGLFASIASVVALWLSGSVSEIRAFCALLDPVLFHGYLPPLELSFLLLVGSGGFPCRLALICFDFSLPLLTNLD